MAVLDKDNLALNDINVDAITNELGTGVFDKLMEAVNKNILVQYNDSRITSGDYAKVYLGSLQTVLAQSIQFVLQEQVSEAQVGGMLKDNELKATQLEVVDIEKSIKQFELTSMLPMQLEKLEEEIDILQTQDSEMLLDGAKKRLIMDEEIATADLQQIILATEEELKNAQKSEVSDATVRANTQLSDSLVTSTEQRAGMVVDKESKQYQLDNLLPKELEAKTEQVLGAYTERLTKDKQAAKLGLDNVMKNSEVSRDADGNFIYVPNYVKAAV